MKKVYIAACFLLISATGFAQSKDTKIADKLFAQYEFVDAAQAYLKLAEQGKGSAYVYRHLAESYYNMFNAVEAARWYARAVEFDQDAETHYRYAQMLKANGQYEQANKQMQKFAQMAPSDPRAKDFLKEPNYIPRLAAKEKLYDVKTLEINSDKSEFGPVLHESNLYFTSSRNASRKSYGWTDEPYLDVYKADYNTDGSITNASAVKSLNSKFHDGPVSLTADGNTIYFTSDSYRERSFERDKANNLKLSRNNIYRATRDGDSWTNITSLSINSKEYSTSNPSVSRDGKMLYFSSDMPGSLGGVDIWRVAVNDDGSLGTPENLGANVNSPAQDSFPFIADDNTTLYFASNGKQGFGGLDLFKIDLAKGTSPENLGKPVNTEKDDFSFSFNKTRNIGFFASNRTGTDDLFQAIPVCAVELIAVVTNATTKALLPGAKVAILDDRRNIITTESANEKAEVSYRVECGKAYTLQVSHPGFEGNSFPVAAQQGSSRKIDAPLQPLEVIITDKEVILKPIYFEFNKHNITSEGAFELDKLVQVMNMNPEMVIMVKAHTDNRGSDRYNMNLSDRRAKATAQYIRSKGISAKRITGKGYGKTELLEDCADNCTEEQHAANRRSEFLIVK
jgi:outer membrane protein OmpA-like peptidoglycan-associated protein/tetratricopeptide (TPR) repeat protein